MTPEHFDRLTRVAVGGLQWRAIGHTVLGAAGMIFGFGSARAQPRAAPQGTQPAAQCKAEQATSCVEAGAKAAADALTVCGNAARVNASGETVGSALRNCRQTYLNSLRAVFSNCDSRICGSNGYCAQWTEQRQGGDIAPRTLNACCPYGTALNQDGVCVACTLRCFPPLIPNSNYCRCLTERL